MKTIPELKAEIVKLEDEIYDLDSTNPKFVFNDRRIFGLNSQIIGRQNKTNEIKSLIDQQVGECEEIVDYIEGEIYKCNAVPLDWKCPSCRAVLKLKGMI